MRRILVFIVAALSIECALAACKKSRHSETQGAAPRRVREPNEGSGADGPSGSVGHNGLIPSAYDRNNRAVLEQLMQQPLTSPPASTNLAPSFRDVSGPFADTLIDYAISCAVPRGTVTRTSPDGYVGRTGLLNSTTAWSNAPLAMGPPDPSPREDIHACIATRLNPSGKPVEIWLGGAHVNNDGLDHMDFGIDEAYWAAFPPHNKDDVVDINVWPSMTVMKSCPDVESAPRLKPAVNTRVCGTPTGNCVTVRTDTAACTNSPGGWQCPRSDGCDCKTGSGCTGADACVEVIKTKLTCTDWCTFYPTCNVPAACVDKIGPVCPAPPP